MPGYKTIRFDKQSMITRAIGFGGNRYDISGPENELLIYIKSIIHYAVDSGNRKVIYPYEIDVFVPKLRRGFEFNGLYWHTDRLLPPDYHQSKVLKCYNNGIRLMHVWEHWWDNNQLLYQSIISTSIGQPRNIVYASKCEVVAIDQHTAQEFNNANNIFGHRNTTVNYGLYHLGKLVQTIGFTYYKSKDTWYIMSNTPLINTMITGGTKLLFNHFYVTHVPSAVSCYIDAATFSGITYEELGFIRFGITRPGYYYVNHSSKTVIKSATVTKQKLVAAGYDKSMTEKGIMLSLGYERVYDAGKWIFVYLENEIDKYTEINR